jgi:hypothetical protein
MILILGQKRKEGMEAKGVEMEPLKPQQGLLIHAFFSLSLPKFLSAYVFLMSFFTHNLGK